MNVNLSSLSQDDLAILAQLKPIFESQEDAAHVLRVIFSLCVAQGIITREEYLERLAATPD